MTIALSYRETERDRCATARNFLDKGRGKRRKNGFRLFKGEYAKPPVSGNPEPARQHATAPKPNRITFRAETMLAQDP